MVQLSALRGQHAGARFIVGRFPFSIGRSGTDLSCEDLGVWDKHLELLFAPEKGIILRSKPDAFTSVNGARTSEAILCNGDVIELGDCKFQFTLAPAPQASLRGNEISAWTFVAGITLAQVFLIYALLGS